MRNPWKGLVIGGLTGAFIGIALDGMRRAGESAQAAKDKFVERAPGAMHKAGEMASALAGQASERLREVDLRTKAEETARRVADSDLAQQAKGAAKDTARKVADSDLAQQAKDAATNAAQAVKDRSPSNN